MDPKNLVALSIRNWNGFDKHKKFVQIMVLITRLSDYIEEYRIKVAAGEVLWRPDHNYENSKHGGQYRVPPPLLLLCTAISGFNPWTIQVGFPNILGYQFYCGTFWTPSARLFAIFPQFFFNVHTYPVHTFWENKRLLLTHSVWTVALKLFHWFWSVEI